jgi:hypothetical protein
MFSRRGVIEVELLRRYGRTPAGTRAVGWFTVSESPGPYMTHVWEVRIRVPGDPRVVGCQCYFPWQQERIDSLYTVGIFYRGAHQTVSAAGLFDYVAQDVVRFVEGLDTSTKQQRFKVVCAAWDDQSVGAGQEVTAAAEPGAAPDRGGTKASRGSRSPRRGR